MKTPTNQVRTLAESVDAPKKKMAMAGKVATSVGGVVLLSVAWKRFKAMVSGKAQTEEQIEAGEEPEKKSFFSKLANGLAGIATAVAGATLIHDVAKGNKAGTSGKAVLGKFTGMLKKKDDLAQTQGADGHVK